MSRTQTIRRKSTNAPGLYAWGFHITVKRGGAGGVKPA